MNIVTITGNPKRASRTSRVAKEVSEQISVRLKSSGIESVQTHIELAEIAPYLFDWNNAEVIKKVEQTLSAHILIVASPTYKATYTGLLKAFLDQLPSNALNGKISIPVMIGAAPIHNLAVETYLRPLLVELGAMNPTRGLYVLESNMNHLSDIVRDWLLNEEGFFVLFNEAYNSKPAR